MTALVAPELRDGVSRLAASSAGRAALRAWHDTAQTRPAAAVPPLRAIHHFACTGGSVICKALSVMPNVTLLSEIDPLSPMTLPDLRKPAPLPFRPQDMLYHAAASPRPPTQETLAESFAEGLRALHRGVARDGRHLVLRDHAHSQFCLDADPGQRPGMGALMRRVAPLRALVTVRHPLASFTALKSHGWIGFTPATLELYARRYMAFLDAHAGAPVLQYEAFAHAPEPFLQAACDALGLGYVTGAAERIAHVRMTGDSGRRSAVVAPREPRPVPDDVAQEASASETYKALCARLGYDT